MATFRLLHISDLHISINPRQTGVADRLFEEDGSLHLLKHGLPKSPFPLVSSYDQDLLMKLSKLAYELQEKNELDAILISGDLATTGNKDDLEQARLFIESPPVSKWFYRVKKEVPAPTDKPTLRWAKVPPLLIPGNHDRFIPGIGIYAAGGSHFDSVFSSYWSARQSAQILYTSPSLVLIGADFTFRPLRLTLDMWGKGKVYKRRRKNPFRLKIEHPLKKLKALTSAARNENPEAGIIWVSHFPPKFPGCPGSLELINDDLLIEAAEKMNVSFILAGHTHEPKCYKVATKTGNGISVSCAGTCTQSYAPKGHVAHLLEINTLPGGALNITCKDRRWNDHWQEFI